MKIMLIMHFSTNRYAGTNWKLVLRMVLSGIESASSTKDTDLHESLHTEL